MAQVTGRKVATTPITPTPSGGNVINSWNTSDNKETNAPSMKIVKDGLDEINDNLTQTAWRDSTATTLEALINGFVASSVNTLENGQTKSIRVDNRNDLWFNVTITRDIGGSSYTGIAISTADASVRYTFRKPVSGGASTVISPFSQDIDWTNDHYLTKAYSSGTDTTYSPTVTIDSGIETFMIFVYGYTQYGSLYYNLVTATNATKLSSRNVSNGYYYIFKKTNKNLSSTVKANNTAPFNHVGAYGMVAISLDS